jgi:hypothetical protein
VSSTGVWVGLATPEHSGIRFDLKAKVRVDGVVVASGTVKGVSGGSTEVAGAVKTTIPLGLDGPVELPPGSTVSIKLLVRNSCSGSLPPMGTARLWFNGPIAQSFLKTKIDNVGAKFFLRGSFTLKPVPGSTEQSLDAAVGAPCGPFVSFGTWNITLP